MVFGGTLFRFRLEIEMSVFFCNYVYLCVCVYRLVVTCVPWQACRHSGIKSRPLASSYTFLVISQVQLVDVAVLLEMPLGETNIISVGDFDFNNLWTFLDSR